MKSPYLIDFQHLFDENGALAVFESASQVPFEIKRVFTVCSTNGGERGAHAHRRCSQLMVCVSGKIRVTCNDGSNCFEFILNNMGTGLLVPPYVWATEEYLGTGVVLMVLCDRHYEAEDYIRDHEEFAELVRVRS